MARPFDVFERRSALQRLRELALRGELSHSLLFVGPEGAGKEAAALALAQLVLCERRHDGAFCGDAPQPCPACHKLRALKHPDVHYLCPAEAGLSNDGYRALLDAKAAEPLARVRQPSSAIISVGDPDHPHPCSVREVRRFVAARPFEGDRRVVIMGDAHRMNRAAANALLKTLEEPPPGALLLLCSHQPHLLPATVRSRCAKLRLPALSDAELADHLSARHGIDAGRAAQIAAVAGGNARRALDLIDPEAQIVAQWASVLLGFLVQGETPALLKGAELVAKGQDPSGGRSGKKLGDASLSASRDVGTRMLDFLVADLLALDRIRQGARISAAQSQRLGPLVPDLGERDLSSMAQVLMAARADLLRNVNVSLVLTHAFLRASGAGPQAARSEA